MRLSPKKKKGESDEDNHEAEPLLHGYRFLCAAEGGTVSPKSWCLIAFEKTPPPRPKEGGGEDYSSLFFFSFFLLVEPVVNLPCG